MKNTFVTRYRVLPVGEKEERDRIYQYYRDAQYNQYLALNQAMSMAGIIYYNCHRNIKSEDFKTQYKDMFKRNSTVWDGVDFPKGGHLQGNVSRKVQSDFSTALKKGLAKGERQLPRYRRDFPYMIHGAEIKPYAQEEEYEGKTRTAYYIKSVNKIHLKFVFGSAERKQYRKVDMIKKLAEEDPAYKICQSNLFFKDNKMFLNLVVTKDVETKKYDPVKGRIMGVSYGFNCPAQTAFSDSENTYSLGDGDVFVEKRIQLQKNYNSLQKALRNAGGGKGRKKKLRALERYKAKEKNFAKQYNHKLSRQIVDMAKEKKVEKIILQQIDTKKLKKNPVLLRNWSYSQIYEMIKYKAEYGGIETDIRPAEDICPCCGCFIELPEFDNEMYEKEFVELCTECGEKINVSQNRAQYLAKQIGEN